jgi:hypothetical protein
MRHRSLLNRRRLLTLSVTSAIASITIGSPPASIVRDAEGQYLLTELELVEPSLFFRHDPAAADRLAAAVMNRVG